MKKEHLGPLAFLCIYLILATWIYVGGLRHQTVSLNIPRPISLSTKAAGIPAELRPLFSEVELPTQQILAEEILSNKPVDSVAARQGEPTADFMQGLKDKLVVDFDATDTTESKSVRTSVVTAGVGYKLNERSTVGFEAEKGFVDSQDSKVTKDEPLTGEAINMKVKMEF